MEAIIYKLLELQKNKRRHASILRVPTPSRPSTTCLKSRGGRQSHPGTMGPKAGFAFVGPSWPKVPTWLENRRQHLPWNAPEFSEAMRQKISRSMTYVRQLPRWFLQEVVECLNANFDTMLVADLTQHGLLALLVCVA